jgi:hypothetical protein
MAVTLVTKKSGKAVITAEHKKQGQVVATHTTEEDVGVPETFDGPPCVVGIECSMTKNMGNYESFKVGVLLHVPAKHHEVEQVFEYVKGWVDDKMQGLLAEVDADAA